MDIFTALLTTLPETFRQKSEKIFLQIRQKLKGLFHSVFCTISQKILCQRTVQFCQTRQNFIAMIPNVFGPKAENLHETILFQNNY